MTGDHSMTSRVLKWLYQIMGNLLGTPETKRRGLRTRNALNALTSKPSICRVDRIVLTTLKKRKKKLRDLCYLSSFSTNILLPTYFLCIRFDQITASAFNGVWLCSQDEQLKNYSFSCSRYYPYLSMKIYSYDFDLGTKMIAVVSSKLKRAQVQH